MQRLCSKLRSLAALSTQPLHTLHSSRRLLHCSPQLLLRYQPPHSIFLGERWSLCSQLFSPSSSFACRSSLRPLPLLHVRHVSSTERQKKGKPMTPITSKVKKIKMKSYSSYKARFRTLNDGTIRRWREGKNHNAHEKSKKAKRRLRRPSTVPAAYAKVMKKLNFCG
uniref:Uncharacterized protein MANES_17G011100 n=1 Tax=Rhizophora mucronata TaxID=61149 RepID=A0A2P2JN22_RHIMU